MGVFRATASNSTIALLTAKNKPMFGVQAPRRQRGSCLSLSDFVSKPSALAGAYCCVVGVEASLIQQFFVKKGKLQAAAVFKTACDALAEACSEQLTRAMRHSVWGFVDASTQSLLKAGIAPAPGYPV